MTLANEATHLSFRSTYKNADGRAAARRVNDLEAAVAIAQAEAEILRAQLRAFETSTTWRLTRPIRAIVGVAKAWRQALLSKGAARHSFISPQQYDDWIATEEAYALAALTRRPKLGYYPKTLSLVIWVAAGCGSAVRQFLTDCPTTCTILLLDQEGTLPLDVAWQGHVMRVAIPREFEPADALYIALDRLDTDMLCFMDVRDRLAPEALALIANTAGRFPSLDILFADEDWLDEEGGRVQPFFKPGWDPELQRGRDLMGPFTFFRTELVRQAAPVTGPAWLYDLANQVASKSHPDRIHHIPAILCHRTTLPEGHATAMAAVMAAQLVRDGVAGRVEPLADASGWNRIIYDLPQPAPLVSIIVPTRDRAALLRACADGVLNHTDYPHLELLIVDNGSEEPEALALLNQLAANKRVVVLRQPGPFNWSALNNNAAARAAGSVLVLLNNDIAVLQPDWLTVLVSHAMQPGVGAVGAKLLFPDGRVQHAGLTTDPSGVPQHLFRYASGGAPGTCGLMGLARQVWGVTGACLAIPRYVFTTVGGLNENLPIAYNDVELCLRLTERGYRILWTPWSKLEHREMGTRRPDHTGVRREQVLQELKQLLDDWGHLIQHDAFLNPNLQLIDGEPHFRKPKSNLNRDWTKH
jgi:GT2 family glycosyltransferase